MKKVMDWNCCLFVLLLLGVISSPFCVNCEKDVPDYNFPDRWQSTTQGWVDDKFLNGNRANVVGFIFSDYTISSQRVDEVWNQTAIHGTTLDNFHITSDTHLFFKRTAWYYYTTPSGAKCSLQVPSLIPQGPWVFNQITYNHLLPDQKLYEFNSSSPFKLYTTPTTPPFPIGLYFGNLGQFFNGTTIHLLSFQEEKNPFASFLFEKPSYCGI